MKKKPKTTNQQDSKTTRTPINKFLWEPKQTVKMIHVTLSELLSMHILLLWIRLLFQACLLHPSHSTVALVPHQNIVSSCVTPLVRTKTKLCTADMKGHFKALWECRSHCVCDKIITPFARVPGKRRMLDSTHTTHQKKTKKWLKIVSKSSAKQLQETETNVTLLFNLARQARRSTFKSKFKYNYKN